MLKKSYRAALLLASVYTGSAFAGPTSIRGVEGMMFSDTVMRGTEQGCSQVAFEYDVTKEHCLAAERKARATLLKMLPNSNGAQRGYYWASCMQESRFGGYGVEYMSALMCVRFTRAKCTPTPPHPRDAYVQCLRALEDHAFYR